MLALSFRTALSPRLLSSILAAGLLAACAGPSEEGTAGDESALAANRGPKILVVGGEEHHHEIFVMNPDGSGKKQLTRGLADSTDPQWSPDGKKIAFTATKNGHRSVHVMDADGDNNDEIKDDAEAPLWSPDGKTIAFTRTRSADSGSLWIWLMDANGEQVRRLTGAASTRDGRASWSADGKRIRYLIGEVGRISVIDADGDNYRSVFDDDVSDAVWSPDGSRVAFTLTGNTDLPACPGATPNEWPSQAQELWVMNANGSHRERVAQRVTAERPVWTPDGERLVVPLAECDGGPSHIFSVDPDNGRRKQLTRGSDVKDADVAVSPKGTKIAFTRTKGDDTKIVIMDADGSDAKTVAEGVAGNGVAVVWNPAAASSLQQ